MSGNPLFDSLTVALKGIDAIPIGNPDDGKCRAQNSSYSSRCHNNSGTADEMDEVKKLRSKFESMSQMPDIDHHYDEIKKFVGLSHCRMGRHRDKAMEAFKSWDLRPVSGSQPTTVTPSEASEEVDHGFSNTTASSFTSLEVIESTPRISPEPPEVVDKLKDLTIGATVESSPRVSWEQSEVADKFESLTMNTATRNTPVQLNDESVSLTEETVTTANNTGIEVADSSTGQTEKVITSVQVENFPSSPTITGFNGAKVQRKGTVRNAGRIFQEIYSHPSPNKMSEGILYILESIEYPGHFKIRSVSQRQSQRNICHGSNPQPIHETQGEKFKGALQAKILAQVILQQYSVELRECGTCGKRHEGWLRAPKEVVRNAVVCMEIFMRMPAYAEVNGEWKITSAAHNILLEFCSFSVEKLGGRMAANNETAQDISDETSAPMMRIAGPPEEYASEEDERSDEDAADESQLDQTKLGVAVSPSRRRSGRLMELAEITAVKTVATGVRGAKKVKDIWRKPWGRGNDGPILDLTIRLARLKNMMEEFRVKVDQHVEAKTVKQRS